MRGARSGLCVLAAALWLAVGAPARAEIRLSDLTIYLNDHEVTVHVVALGAVPPTFYESIHSGIPAHVRFTIELWQYNRFWRDRLLTTQLVERHLTYNLVTKEYRVTFLKGETRPVYSTRDLRDAQRVLSELRATKLTPASELDPDDIIYVRVRAATALNGENTFVARMAGTAEQTLQQSDFRRIRRVQ
ncbi:MAG TPA: DUF4390 domain-containing protein [Methylomirabilota bacterium]|jgi:hypothetical protein|nr:DUF4390 domain-containing protein [Methylomirabilota bacterium]